jgi:hypothetical protein
MSVVFVRPNTVVAEKRDRNIRCRLQAGAGCHGDSTGDLLPAPCRVSPALADLPVRKVIIQALESIGFVYVRTRGSHAVYRDQQGRGGCHPAARRGKARHARIDSAAGGLDLPPN